MIKRNSLSHAGKGVSVIDIWSIFYLLMVYSFTLSFDQPNLAVFAVYFICALPFYDHLDKFVCICFLLSTMAYYFLGGDEGIWSIYTILALMMVLKLFSRKRILLYWKPVLYFFWMVLAVILSYTQSKFMYTNGMFAMIYNIAISLLIVMTIKMERSTMVSFLPRMAAFQLFAYMGILLLTGYYDGYGFSISKEVNHNTFGASVALLSVVLFTKIVFFQDKSVTYRLAWAASLVLAIVSGSRNALLAMVLTSVILYLVCQKLRNRTLTGGIKLLLTVCLICLLGILILPEFDLDLTRYNYLELLSSGGSDRIIIWQTLSPVIWRDYKWFGYGPGHFCSEQMISLLLLNRDYTHTHNTIFEAWAELGIFGLLPFLRILLLAYQKGRHDIHTQNSCLLMGFLLIAFLFLGLGESFFANISLWIVLGILLGGRRTMGWRKE